jgi:hypothetical protein
MLKPRLNDREAWITQLEQRLHKVVWYFLFIEDKESPQFLCKGDVFLTEIRGNDSSSNREGRRVLPPLIHLSVKFAHRLMCMLLKCLQKA